MATIRGNDRANTLNGTEGSDLIYARGGNDMVSGLGGNDSLYGELGSDTLAGGYGSDYVNGGDGNDIITDEGYGNDTLLGGAGDDDISGDNYETSGTSTRITIRGGLGNDKLYGYEGMIYGGDGRDLIVGTYTGIYGGAGDDNIIGDDSSVFGDAGNDTIDGNGSTFYGGAGNDVIEAGDVAVGFLRSDEGVDTINNFDPYDNLYIKASGFGGGLQPGDLAQDQFVLGTAARDREDRFIYNSNNGNLFYDPDGTGSASKVQLATLTEAPVMSASDIEVF